MICLHKSTAVQEDKFLVHVIALRAERGVAVLFLVDAAAAFAKSDRIKIIVASGCDETGFPGNLSVKPQSNLFPLAAWEMRVTVERHLGFVPLHARDHCPGGEKDLCKRVLNEP